MGPLSPASLLLVLALLQGATGRPYSEERQLLDRHLVQLGRALPDAPTPDSDAALLRQIATEAGLRSVEVGPPTITETGALGQSRRVITATSTYPDADRFFRALQGSPRLVEVESLILRGVEFGVSIETRVRLYHRASRAAPSATLSTTRMRDRTRGATREEALRFMRDEQVVLEKSIALDDLRRRQTSPRMFLAETGSAFRDAVAALTFASLDGDAGRFTLRGVVAGLGAADALERRLEGGFFRLREFSRTPQGGCYQFEVVGESFRAGPEASLPLPVDEPFRPTEPLCRMDRDAPGVANATLRAQGSGPDGLTLRTIDADLADVAAMIEALSREPLVVAEEVRGRVHVDFAGASVDDALNALPVRVDRLGAVRLLRSAGAPELAAAAEPVEAPPVGGFSLRAKRVLGEDVIAALAETEPAYIALGPKLLAKLSVFARDAPIEDVRRAVLAALRLEEGVDENGGRVLRFREGGIDPGPITATSSGRVVFRPRDLMVDETTLAGIGRSTTEFVAFAYSPLGEIVALRTGDALADGVIASLDANAMLIDTAEGPVRISLATVPQR